MIKQLPFFLIIFFSHRQVHAQSNSVPKEQKFGFRLGANLSSMNFNGGYQVTTTPVETGAKAGIALGFFLRIHLAKDLSIKPEYLYSEMGGKVKNLQTSYKFNYLSMPVLLKYRFTSRLAVEAGPHVALLINAKDNSSGKYVSITHDVEERDLGAIAGLDIRVLKNIYVDARYILGLSHINIRQTGNEREFTHRVFQLTAAVQF